MKEVILSGSLSVDRIMNFNGRYQDLIQADKLHVLSLSVLIDKLEDSQGGIAGNIAYNLALLNDTSSILTCVGTDAKKYLNFLAKQHIDISHIQTTKLPTATFTVMTDMSDNQVGGFYPGAMSQAGKLSLKPWADTDSIVVVSAHDPQAMRRHIKEAVRYHLTCLYDPSQQVSNIPSVDLMAGIKAANVIIVNDYELGILATKCGLSEQKLKQSVPIFITTLGAAGSVIEGKNFKSPQKIAAVKLAAIVDPTGAGDAYRAGFLYGFRRGWEIKKCAQLGSTMASFAIEHRGTQKHHFTKKIFTNRHQQAFGYAIKW